MTERWKELIEYPGYAVSDYGNILNIDTDILKRPSTNQQGILMVNFSIRNKQHVRSVALLVANAFLQSLQPNEHFNTPINLDGDRRNCHINNLLWRPRWFAIKYHQQFSPYERANRFGFKTPIEMVETGEQFATSWEAATKYGLLDLEIFIAAQNNTYVFPIGKKFRMIE